jgi:glutamate-1-semialdehyde aminotransferase
MPFRRFFDRGAKQQAPPTEPVDETLEDTESVEAAEDESDEAPPDIDDRVDWRARAEAVLPTGASTGSKRTEALYGAADATGPTHFIQAVGCRVTDVDGNTYIDCSMALGAVALGYAEPNVTRAVIDAAAHGNVSGLSSAREVDVAERLRGMIPCAEMAQFLKTGAEAIAAGVRIARTYTGRDVVVGCGYFGWLDWSSTAAGVPAATRADYRSVPFDDIAALETTAQSVGNKLAAIVIEPVIERLPSTEWIAKARELCDSLGAVLIFDEIKTGFRLRTGGYQAYADVTPDLAAFGKAMSNGYPLSAIVGRRDVMEAARRTWISSTLASDAVALAAAAAVLDWHNQAEITESLWSTGAELRKAVGAAIEASGIDGVTVDGLDPMWLLRFDDAGRERRFLELAAANGVLFKRGAYNYAALAHDEEAVQEIEHGASAAFVELLEEESHG